MRFRLGACAVILAMGLVGTGCSAINDFGRFMFGDSDGGVSDGGPDDDGGGPDDAGVDGSVDAGFDAGVPRGPTTIVQTSGGGTVENGQHRLRVSFGAPQPAGQVENAQHRLRTGPQSR